MARDRGAFPIGLMCQVLQVSRSGFYAFCRRGPSARTRRDQQLLVAIRTIHRQSQRRYGSPRVHQA